MIDMPDDKESRILRAATTLFLRYGYKRVNMHDIAQAATISRPALYLVFKNKAEIFRCAYEQWSDETIAGIERQVEGVDLPAEKLRFAFELWFILPYEEKEKSPELKEFMECDFEFARDSLRLGNRRLEEAVEKLLQPIVYKEAANGDLTAKRLARLMVAAVNGFSYAAETSDDLKRLINDLIALALRPASNV